MFIYGYKLYMYDINFERKKESEMREARCRIDEIRRCEIDA